MSATTCPRCGRAFDPAIDRWKRAEAMPGRVPAHLWAHRRPDNRKRCIYADGGSLVAYANNRARAILTAEEYADTSREACMAG